MDALVERTGVAEAEPARSNAPESGRPVSPQGAAPSAARHKSRAPKTRALKLAAWLSTLAELMWLPQAACLAYGIGQIAEGYGIAAIWPLAAAVTALGLAKAVLERAGNRMAYRAARNILSEKREIAIAALTRRSPLDTGRAASGEAASILAEQAEHIVPYLARFQTARFKASVVPLAILAVVLPYSWIAALVLMIAAPLIPVFMALIGWSAQSASEKHLANMGTLNAFLLDRLRGLQTIRSFDAVEQVSRRLRLRAENLRRRTMAVLKIAFLTSAVLELFSALGVAMAAAYIGFHLLGQIGFGAWGGKLTLSEGLFILLLAPAFFDPLRMLSSVWHDRAAGEAALSALDSLAEEGLSMAGGAATEGATTTARPASVELSDLGFVHQGSKDPVFDGFDLTVKPGEHVALLGPSGSGKSTLLALIAGLAEARHGRIVIDGVTLGDDTADGLRAKIAWIGQNPHLFAGSIASNIRLNRENISRDDIAGALKLSALDTVAEAHGHAMIGENGAGLSGGEGLRLTLARAAAGKGAGLILADEPTAHLDHDTAAGITEALLALAAGRTLIVATHDPVLAAKMDRVVHLAQDFRENTP
ncbi:thiol reductant ABC exporter subunit CydD [Martelella soudanensis]|uniref:thiol reductant ABC exporter subunit CydD n=1 Tax=unclassified Martelella TaxID=2629616 RepID=UPI0015DF9CF1|nr:MULTISPECIES: thiol reductant ABC exporter subunit CydD [unclassified Martelella]